METTRALTVGHGEGGWYRSVVDLALSALGEGEVLVAIDYSCINYKDGLAGSETGRVARIDPLVPGVDLAGTVIDSSDPAVSTGSAVIVHGYDLGVARHGGFAGHARVPASWIVPMPDGLDARTAMLVGTAGYTAALSVLALEAAGLEPGHGDVLVTGATGGVGSMAVGMLARRGHRVIASTGKSDAGEWLRRIGASDIIDRAELAVSEGRPLERERWAGAVDCVGGATLAHVIRTLRYGASVAASGLTGGSGLSTTVLPFILRGVNLLGIDSVQTPIDRRREVWRRIATDLRPSWLDDASTACDCEVGLDGVAVQMDRILGGEMRGRVLVDPHR